MSSSERGADDARRTQPPLRLQPIRELVLVRARIARTSRMRRKGWIMSVKLTDAQLAVMMSTAAQRKDFCLSGAQERSMARLSAKRAPSS